MGRPSIRVLLVASIFLCAVAGLARAKSDPWAHEQFKKASTHFSLGRFDEAAAEYLLLYQRHPEQKALLFNVAQSYRLGGKSTEALDYYKQYLATSPNAENRADAEQRIQDLESAAAAKLEAEKAPVVAAVPSPQPLVAAAAPDTASTAPPAPRDKPIYKKWWFWTIVAGVVVVAVVVPTAVVLSEKKATFHTDTADFGPGSNSGLTVRW